MANSGYKTLIYTTLEYDTAAVEAIEPGATINCLIRRGISRNLVVVAHGNFDTIPEQLIYRKREHDFPWFPACVVCHDILGQTALVDLAGLRDAMLRRA